jgi:hypothetical protein
MKSEKVFVVFLAIWSSAAAYGPLCKDFQSDLVIPSSTYCGGRNGEQGIAVAMRKLFEFIPLECLLDIFFDAIVMDKEVNEFFNYITGPEFHGLICKLSLKLSQIISQSNKNNVIVCSERPSDERVSRFHVVYLC